MDLKGRTLLVAAVLCSVASLSWGLRNLPFPFQLKACFPTAFAAAGQVVASCPPLTVVVERA